MAATIALAGGCKGRRNIVSPIYYIILVGFQEDSIEYRLQLQLQNETINLW